MTNKVLILGGSGRIGGSVAEDIHRYTPAQITITGRKFEIDHHHDFTYLSLDLDDIHTLNQAIAESNLVIHCAGPFHFRDTQVLEACIKFGVNYLDVSDHRSYTAKALKLNNLAQTAGITAIINTGIFPGISNSMVRQCVEALDEPETIHLSYVVSGSGGAGITVMRTTFLGLQNPFAALINGEWQQIKPYTQREIIDFPPPYGRCGVYWYDMPETFTLPATFPTVKTTITKFGSLPDYYNHLTWIAAHVFPKFWIKSQVGMEFLSQVSHIMTDVTDRFTGIGVSVRASVTGKKNNTHKTICSTFTHANTAIAAGCGTGSIAQLLLSGELHKPGVHPPEAALPTDLFTKMMEQRGMQTHIISDFGF